MQGLYRSGRWLRSHRASWKIALTERYLSPDGGTDCFAVWRGLRWRPSSELLRHAPSRSEPSLRSVLAGRPVAALADEHFEPFHLPLKRRILYRRIDARRRTHHGLEMGEPLKGIPSMISADPA